jgi:hypothetical protein
VFISLLPHACSAHLILLDFIMLIRANRPIRVVRNINYESSHYGMFPSLFTCWPLITESPPQNSSSNIPNLCSSRNVRDHVSRPHKTTGKTGLTNVAVEWVAHVLRTQYVLGSRFDRITNILRVSVVLLSPSRQIPG